MDRGITSGGFRVGKLGVGVGSGLTKPNLLRLVDKQSCDLSTVAGKYRAVLSSL